MDATGLGRSSIYERMNPDSKYFDSTFPASVPIGQRGVGWYEEDVVRWVSSRANYGDDAHHQAAAAAMAPQRDAPAVEGPIASKKSRPLASSKRDSSRDAELLLADIARAGEVVSLYQFLQRLREQGGDNSDFPTDQVLDAIDLAAYRKSKRLPSVLIQENGAPLERAKRLASTLGVGLTKDEVMAQRQQLFLDHLRPSDPRPLGFRWIDVRRRSVMNPYYKAKRPEEESPLTPEEKAQSDAMHARYAALLPNASSKPE